MTAYKQTLGLIHQSNVQLIVNRLLTLITPLNRRRKKIQFSKATKRIEQNYKLFTAE
jgi:hypothetical protein